MDCGGIKNFGDELNPYLITKLTGLKPKRVQITPVKYSNKRILIAVGSVMDKAYKTTAVWGELV